MTTTVYVREPVGVHRLTPHNPKLENEIRRIAQDGSGTFTIPDNSEVVLIAKNRRILEIKDERFKFKDSDGKGGYVIKEAARTDIATFPEGNRFANSACGDSVGLRGTIEVSSNPEFHFPAVEKVVNTTNLSSGKERR